MNFLIDLNERIPKIQARHQEANIYILCKLFNLCNLETKSEIQLMELMKHMKATIRMSWKIRPLHILPKWNQRILTSLSAPSMKPLFYLSTGCGLQKLDPCIKLEIHSQIGHTQSYSNSENIIFLSMKDFRKRIWNLFAWNTNLYKIGIIFSFGFCLIV